MKVWLIETRYKDFKEYNITTSYDRAERELSTAEERNVEVIVTPFEVEDLKGVNYDRV